MLAIDTNVIVRFLTSDHPEQSPLARTLIDTHDVFVCTTVLLKTEWVLRAAYGHPPAQVGAALRAFAEMPRVTLEDPTVAATALDWMERGMDITDDLNLTKAEGSTAFVSIDRQLQKAAKRLSQVEVRRP